MFLPACTQPQCLYSRARILIQVFDEIYLLIFSSITLRLKNLTSYGTCRLYRASVPVEISRASVPAEYIYISTSPMGRTSFRVSVFLYSKIIQYSPFGLFIIYRPSVPVKYFSNFTHSMGHTGFNETQYF